VSVRGVLTSRRVGARFIGDDVATAAGVAGLDPTDEAITVDLTTSDFTCSGGLAVAAPISSLPGCCRLVDTGAGLEGVGAVFGFAGAGTADPDGTAAFASAGVGSEDSGEATALPFNDPARDLEGSTAVAALAHGAGDVGVRTSFCSGSTVADSGGLADAVTVTAGGSTNDFALASAFSAVSGLTGLSIGCFGVGSATICARPFISSFGCASTLAGVPTLKGVAGIAGMAGVIWARDAVRDTGLEENPLRPGGTALADAEKPGGIVGVDRRESSKDLRAAKDSPRSSDESLTRKSTFR